MKFFSLRVLGGAKKSKATFKIKENVIPNF